jgi:hypothetical protein
MLMVKVTPKMLQRHKGFVAVLLYSFATSALDGDCQRQTSAVLSPGKKAGTACTEGWVALESVLDGWEKISTIPGFELRTLQPTAGCCTNDTIPANVVAYYEILGWVINLLKPSGNFTYRQV